MGKNGNNVVIYAIKRVNQQIVCVSDVERGKACDCICLSCGGDLIAKKGIKRIHHFSHASGIECEGFKQTELHLLAKELFNECEYIILPEVYLFFDNKKYLIHNVEKVFINKVMLERRLEGGCIPDVILDTNIGKIIIEIYVTNKTSHQKVMNYSMEGYMALEIELNNFSRDVRNLKIRNNLIRTIQDNVNVKSWISHPDRNKKREQLKEEKKEKELIVKKQNKTVKNRTDSLPENGSHKMKAVYERDRWNELRNQNQIKYCRKGKIVLLICKRCSKQCYLPEVADSELISHDTSLGDIVKGHCICKNCRREINLQSEKPDVEKIILSEAELGLEVQDYIYETAVENMECTMPLDLRNCEYLMDDGTHCNAKASKCSFRKVSVDDTMVDI